MQCWVCNPRRGRARRGQCLKMPSRLPTGLKPFLNTPAIKYQCLLLYMFPASSVGTCTAHAMMMLTCSATSCDSTAFGMVTVAHGGQTTWWQCSILTGECTPVVHDIVCHAGSLPESTTLTRTRKGVISLWRCRRPMSGCRWGPRGARARSPGGSSCYSRYPPFTAHLAMLGYSCKGRICHLCAGPRLVPPAQQIAIKP